MKLISVKATDIKSGAKFDAAINPFYVTYVFGTKVKIQEEEHEAVVVRLLNDSIIILAEDITAEVMSQLQAGA